jgi:hypothetical protein
MCRLFYKKETAGSGGNPVGQTQPADSGEFASIVGYQNGADAMGVSADSHIQRADDAAPLFQLGPAHSCARHSPVNRRPR